MRGTVLLSKGYTYLAGRLAGIQDTYPVIAVLAGKLPLEFGVEGLSAWQTQPQKLHLNLDSLLPNSYYCPLRTGTNSLCLLFCCSLGEPSQWVAVLL